MKKIFALILTLLLTFPMLAMAAPSPTTTNLIQCEPKIPFEALEEINFQIYLEGYTLLEVLQITLEEHCEEVVWHLPVEIAPEDEIKVVIFGNGLFINNTTITEDCGITVDFSGIAPDTYYLYFFKRDDAL